MMSFLMGYEGYKLERRGDPIDTVYDTASTPSNVSTTIPEPDVFLNASVSVGEISILVANLTAKVNLDARVLSLVKINAGVDASIDRVTLVIRNVSAHALLEARLANLAAIVDNVLGSVQGNPNLLTIGTGVGNVPNGTESTPEIRRNGTQELQQRAFLLEQNILYSVNDYSGQTHTNRMLTKDGSLVDKFLDNTGAEYDSKLVGNYEDYMSFTGYNKTVTHKGKAVRELRYLYTPFNGVDVVSAIYMNFAGAVEDTQVLSESGGGGSSTIANEPEMS
ncbi:hypothetical protein PRK78_005383 [Emydomyces testavorans]|uniref:Uncharacterized protein n=1 Tax=Emydomyces testavorans TaxID=2070801 RepID=A0AAF0DLZ3_9EURO|nr:hypothetical protein PRK78_005383 [Emydomyces testavorans]